LALRVVGLRTDERESQDNAMADDSIALLETLRKASAGCAR
jgi:hypothetical protein